MRIRKNARNHLTVDDVERPLHLSRSVQNLRFKEVYRTGTETGGAT